MPELCGRFAPGIHYASEKLDLIVEASLTRWILRQFTHDGRRVDVHVDCSNESFLTMSATLFNSTHSQVPELLALRDLYNKRPIVKGRSFEYYPVRRGLYPNRWAVLQKVDNPDREAVYQVVKEFFDELFSAGADIADGSGRSTRAYMRRLLNKAA